MGRITSTVTFQVQQQKRRGSKCYFSARGNPGLATAPAEKTIAPTAPWDLATFLSYLLLKSATLIPWNEDILQNLVASSMSTSSREEQSACTISSHTTELATCACAGFSSSPVIPSPTSSGAYPIPTW